MTEIEYLKELHESTENPKIKTMILHLIIELIYEEMSRVDKKPKSKAKPAQESYPTKPLKDYLHLYVEVNNLELLPPMDARRASHSLSNYFKKHASHIKGVRKDKRSIYMYSTLDREEIMDTIRSWHIATGGAYYRAKQQPQRKKSETKPTPKHLN